jgi:hypothetical protein
MIAVIDVSVMATKWDSCRAVMARSMIGSFTPQLAIVVSLDLGLPGA